MLHIPIKWRFSWRIDKYAADGSHTVSEFADNLLTNAGGALLLDLLIGAGGTSYAASNARIAVGSSAAVEAVGQTTLTTELTRVAASAARAGQTVTWVATFGAGIGTGTWNEFGILNAGAAGTLLNRRVQSEGAKAAGDSWTVTATGTVA